MYIPSVIKLTFKDNVITFVRSWKNLILTEFVVEFKVYLEEEMPVQKIKSKICIHVQITVKSLVILSTLNTEFNK